MLRDLGLPGLMGEAEKGRVKQREIQDDQARARWMRGVHAGEQVEDERLVKWCPGRLEGVWSVGRGRTGVVQACLRDALCLASSFTSNAPISNDSPVVVGKLLDESLAMDLIKETITATVLVRPWAGRFAVDGLDRGDLGDVLQYEDGIDEGLRVKGGTPLLIEWTLVNQSGL